MADQILKRFANHGGAFDMMLKMSSEATYSGHGNRDAGNEGPFPVAP